MEKIRIDDDLLVMAGDNVLDFSLGGFVNFAVAKNTSCVMCHDEYDLKKQQKTAIITKDALNLITSYEEKPVEPKGHYAVPPFYFYKAEDIPPNGILEFKVNALEDELIRFNHRLLLKSEENHVYFAEGLKALITI